MITSAGVQIHRISPLGEAYKLANDWLKVNDREEWERRQNSSHPQSQYAGLRYALEDGDKDLAKAEAAKLGSKAGDGFKRSVTHPFTSSLAQDQKFYDSLDEHDKKIYDAALKRRALLLERYRMWVGPIKGDLLGETVEGLRYRQMKASLKAQKEELEEAISQ
jgi:hypothetical protein